MKWMIPLMIYSLQTCLKNFYLSANVYRYSHNYTCHYRKVTDDVALQMPHHDTQYIVIHICTLHIHTYIHALMCNYMHTYIRTYIHTSYVSKMPILLHDMDTLESKYTIYYKFQHELRWCIVYCKVNTSARKKKL